jgi:hypothetical protein
VGASRGWRRPWGDGNFAIISGYRITVRLKTLQILLLHKLLNISISYIGLI